VHIRLSFSSTVISKKWLLENNLSALVTESLPLAREAIGARKGRGFVNSLMPDDARSFLFIRPIRSKKWLAV
jgi:hypothetical protein